MTTLITGAGLLRAIEPDGFIKNGIASSVEGAKYDFRIDPLILKASFGTPVDLGKLPEDQRAKVKVDPGEVVFVRTMERLTLPNNVIALLSPKRKLSQQGIIVLGGFSVDPRYKGPLFVGLYNFSSTPFPIQPGKKLIAAMFYELAEQEVADFPVPEASTEDGDFPEELVTLIRNYKPVEMKWVVDALNDTQKRIDALSAEFHDDRSWKQDFQDALERQSKQIDKMLAGLEQEKEARKEEDSALKRKFESVSNFFTAARIGGIIVWTIIVLILGAVAGVYVPRLLQTAPPPQAPSAAPTSTPSATPNKTP